MKFRSLVFAGAAAVALAVPAAASAQDSTSITLNPGSLTFTDAFDADDFPATTITGLRQTVTTGTGTWSVNDARGSLLGWNVKIRASQFTTGGASPKTLPEGSLRYGGLSVSDILAGAGQLLSLSPVPAAVTAAIDSASGTNDQGMVSAALGLGGGEWDFAAKSAGLTLTVPAEAAAGTYSSIITTTLASGGLG